MKPFHLDVEDGSRIHVDSIVLLDILCQAQLIMILDVHKLLLAFLIVRVDFQFSNLRQVCDPLASNLICHPGGQLRISVKQETSLGNAVGLVVELLRHHLVEIF